MKPLIVVNFKTYETAHADCAEGLARAMAEADAATDAADFVVVVFVFDLAAVKAAAPSLQVWTQHLDPIGFGSNTGWLHPETAQARGAVGTIINHAEHKVSLNHVRDLLSMLPEGFPVCACAADIDEAKALAALNPEMIAVEPPELIGGDISVTTADPEVVRGTAETVKLVNPAVRVLCGAGVKNGADVAAAIQLGTEGVLLASGVTKAKDVAEVLADLVSEL